MKTLPAETVAEVLSAAQMRAIEQAAIARGDVTGLELMERAGKAVADAIIAKWPGGAPVVDVAGGQPPDPRDVYAQKKQGRSAVVFCGPGNNGGDGFVIARLLRERGWAVEVWFYGDLANQPPDAAVSAARWAEIGAITSLSDDARPDLAGHHVVVDALFGTGLTRPLTDLGRVLRDICDCVDAGGGLPLFDRLRHWPPVVAVDVPSGLCADSGKVLVDAGFSTRGGSRAACAVADLTVSFHAPKRGHLLADGPRWCGTLVCADIGLDHRPAAQLSERVYEASAKGVQLRPQGHKYSHGHALVIAGGAGQGGAARLAARAALRIGAGAVTVGCPQAALTENAAQLNAVMLREIDTGDALAEALSDQRINAVCIGPGLGSSDDRRDLIRVGLQRGRSLVLDADALTLIARDPALFAMLHDKCVLTPHAGEFARLFPDLIEQMDAPAKNGPAFSKVDATLAAARRAGCVVLFKGPDTVIADQSGRCSINASAYERAAPWLATAGSGDVLAGFIAGLLARGYNTMRAAETGAWLHTQCALSFGPGLIAEDLPEELPKVFRSLGH